MFPPANENGVRATFRALNLAATLGAAAVLSMVSPDRCAGQAIDLVRARSLGYIDYAWSGRGNNLSMNLTITNRTDREWLIHVEVGTRLQPSSENVQAMVVTEEVRVTAHPHDRQVIEVRVSCLDISKAAPGSTDVVWEASVVPTLAAFISCAASLGPSDNPGARRGLVQFSLWQARGATRRQWIDFLTHADPPMSQADAEQAVVTLAPLLGDVVRQCPAI